MKNDYIYFLIPSLIVIIVMIISVEVLVYHKDEYKKALIEFKHARYVIDPATGKSDFVVDKAP